MQPISHLILIAGGIFASCLMSSCQSQPASETSDITAACERIVSQIARTSFPDRTVMMTVPADAESDQLATLQQCIDSCHLLGGGHVVVPAATYPLHGPLHLRSNVDLHLEQGARLLFSGRPDDFLPVVFTRWEGTELYGRSPMVYAYMQTNIAITGQGEIDAQGSLEMARWGMAPDTEVFEENAHGTHGETLEMPDVNRLRSMGESGVPVQKRVFGEGALLRPAAIEMVGCSRVLLEDFTLRDSPFWCIHPLYSDNVIVRRVTIDSHSPNNDGCDPESSSNVLIEDCLFRTGDDAIAIKAGRDADGRRIGRPSQNIVIRHCDFQSECNGLCIGSEMSGGVQHVYMTDVRIGRVKNALLFKSNLDRGGYIRDVMVDSISIAHTQGAVLRFETNYFGYRGGNFPAQYEDFQISRVYADSTEAYAIYYDGNPQKPIRRIEVDDFHVSYAPHPYYLFHTEQCTFRNSTIGGESVPLTPEESQERHACDVW